MFKLCQKVTLFRVNTHILAYFVAYLVVKGFVVLCLSLFIWYCYGSHWPLLVLPGEAEGLPQTRPLGVSKWDTLTSGPTENFRGWVLIMVGSLSLWPLAMPHLLVQGVSVLIWNESASWAEQFEVHFPLCWCFLLHSVFGWGSSLRSSREEGHPHWLLIIGSLGTSDWFSFQFCQAISWSCHWDSLLIWGKNESTWDLGI